MAKMQSIKYFLYNAKGAALNMCGCSFFWHINKKRSDLMQEVKRKCSQKEIYRELEELEKMRKSEFVKTWLGRKKLEQKREKIKRMRSDI